MAYCAKEGEDNSNYPPSLPRVLSCFSIIADLGYSLYMAYIIFGSLDQILQCDECFDIY